MMNDLKKLISRLPGLARWRFRNILRNAGGLKLDFRANREGADILKNIFIEREYADYFPFHEAATIIDVGGHYGYFALFAARHAAPGARVWVLEPSSANFRILKQNLAKNGARNVYPLQIALAGRPGAARLFLHAHSFNHSTAFRSGKYEEIPAFTLAQFMEEHGIGRADFLKLDCEGAEYDILLNMGRETMDRIRTVSLEFHDPSSLGGACSPNQLARRLEQYGFRVVKFHYSRAYGNLNFGKIIATKLFSA